MNELSGKTVALPETRELDVLARLFEKRGAAVVRCPLVRILDAPDAGPVEAWLRRFVDNRCDDLILLTGEGFRRLRGFAARARLEDVFVEALSHVRTITRGPKPVRALQEVGASADIRAEVPTTEGVIAALSSLELHGRTVGVQLYGTEPNLRLMDFLRAAGANADPVAPYVYADKTDDDRVVDLVERIAGGGVDVLAFTSASQIRRLWQVARERSFEQKLSAGLKRTKVAAIGPVAADEAIKFGMDPAIVPPRLYSMKPFVVEITNALTAETNRGN